MSVNGSNSTTVTRKDLLGRVINVAEPSVGQGGDLTTYTYNVLDKLACVKPGASPDMSNCTSSTGSQYRAFGYDSFGFLRSETTPEEGNALVTYGSYDALGDVLTETQPPPGSGNLTLTRTYDAAGRLTGVTTNETGSPRYLTNCYDGSTAQPTCVDGSQNSSGGTYPLAKVTRRIGFNPLLTPTVSVTDDLSYSNAAGRLSSKTSAFSSGLTPSVTQSWTYNTLGLLATHSHPRSSVTSTFTANYTYTNGLPTALAVSGDVTKTVVSAATYNPCGGLASWTAGNTVVTTIQQDSSLMCRPLSMATTGASSNFSTGNYAYDGVGNITQIGGSGSADTFTYDARSRLLSASYSGQGSQAYIYDKYGNMTSRAGVGLPVDYATNHLTGSGVSYDPRGNLTSYPPDTLTYDGMNRQIKNVNSSSGTWTYIFDGAGERVARVPGSGSATYTLRDEGNRVTTEYVYVSPNWVPGRDNVFLGNALVASYVSVSQSGTPGWNWYHSDHLGTPRLVTDASHNTVETHKYWPYGDDTSTSSQRLRFATMERDTEASHFYDHARSHDFNLGRFLGPDILGGEPDAPQSWNRYSYALNNPLRFVDPNGRQAAEAAAAGLVTTGFVATAVVMVHYTNLQIIMTNRPKTVATYMAETPALNGTEIHEMGRRQQETGLENKTDEELKTIENNKALPTEERLRARRQRKYNQQRDKRKDRGGPDKGGGGRGAGGTAGGTSDGEKQEDDNEDPTKPPPAPPRKPCDNQSAPGCPPPRK